MHKFSCKNFYASSISCSILFWPTFQTSDQRFCATMSLRTVPIRIKRSQPYRNQPYRLTDTHFTYASTPVAFIFLRTISCGQFDFWPGYNSEIKFFSLKSIRLFSIGWFLLDFSLVSHWFCRILGNLTVKLFYRKLKIKFDFSFHLIPHSRPGYTLIP